MVVVAENACDASACPGFLLRPAQPGLSQWGMARWLKFGLVLLGLLLVGLVAIAVALQQWAGSDDLRQRIEREAGSVLGLPVRVGSVNVDVWPVPAVALESVRIGSQPAVMLGRIEARLSLLPLLRARIEVATLLVRKATVPEQAIAVMSAAMLKKKGPGASGGGASTPVTRQPWWPRQLRLDEVSWIDAGGVTTTVDAQVAMGPDGLPATASAKVARGRLAGGRATLKREGEAWRLQANIGGGKASGRLLLRALTNGATSLQGSLDMVNVEVATLTAPNRTLTGRLDAKTTFQAQLRDQGNFSDALKTQTDFNVRGAVIHGIDLRAAVKTVGLSRGGDTPLDMLSGHLATQGKAVRLTNLVAASGALAATGDVAMAVDKALSGRINVDLTGGASGGAIGIPLVLGGTSTSPSVTLSRGALLGAAIGTAVLPGLGTGAGAKLGDRLGQGLGGLFGK